MKKKQILLLIFITTCHFAFAQSGSEFCGTKFPGEEWEIAFQKLIAKNGETWDQTKKPMASYTIPVVFHVIHGGETLGTFPNILPGQLNSQIIALNEDFSGNPYNAMNYPLNAFTNWAINQALPTANLDTYGRVKIADFSIQFCLATIDPNGNPLTETGIDRINFFEKGWTNPTQFTTQTAMKAYLDGTVKPQSIWDVTKYLNVWITDKSSVLTNGGVSSVPPLSGLMGIPNTATDSTDGIWCYTKAIGSHQIFPTGIYVSQNIDGRTMTHEVGHYLGLRHIWGDANCGNDFCNDTPPAFSENSGAPTYPFHIGTCSLPSNNPDGEMFMNFMDYTMGPSKYMFTTDQKNRAHTAMQNSPFRNQLGTHYVCEPTLEITDKQNKPDLLIYPNPTNGTIRIGCPNNKIESIKLYTSSGNFLIEYNVEEFSIAQFDEGLFFVVVQTKNGNFIEKVLKTEK